MIGITAILPLWSQSDGEADSPTLYFEPPRAVSTGESRFPQLISHQGELLLLHQLTEDKTADGGTVFISALRSRDGQEWEQASGRIGPVRYSGASEPFVYSAAIGPDEALYVAVSRSADETNIYRSTDRGETFDQIERVLTEQTTVAPRLFRSGDGSILLFVNTNVDGRQQPVYTRSENGRDWSPIAQLEPNPEVGLVFLPALASLGGRDYVVYQGLNITARSTYQLYLKTSDDGGATWSTGRRITDFVDSSLSDNPDFYDNQRPDLVADPSGAQLILSWERRFQTGNPQIYLLGLASDGSATGLIEEVTGRFELARFPRVVFDNGEPVLVWFTNPQGNSRVVIGRRGGFRWTTETLSPTIGEATYAIPVDHRNRLHIVWQRRSGERGSDIVYAEPDQSVAPPTILAASFPQDGRSRNERAVFSVQDPQDASGIRGYAWVWSRDPDSPVAAELRQRVPDRQVTVRAEEEGPWYLRLRATDFAGNWSEPVTARFVLDTTPPPPVTFPPPRLDENGFLASNTFQVGWEPPESEEFISGYSVRLDYLGPDARGTIDQFGLPSMPERVTTPARTIGRTNVDNGLWRLAVAAVDSVGNVGPTRVLPLRLNKYVPVTRVFSVFVERDVLGRYRLAVLGRGFESNGEIRQVVLDRDGSPPYDYQFNAWQDAFEIDADTRLSGLTLEDVSSGTYRLGLLHSERGMYIAPEPVRLEERGVVKYGDFRPVFDPVVNVRPVTAIFGDTREVAFVLVIFALVILILVSSVRLVVIGGEIKRLNVEARALVTGREAIPPQTRRERTRSMKVRGGGLRVKFAFFVVLLVIGVVVLVAVVLGRNVLDRQETVLTQGLRQRIELLVEGQVTGSRPALENPQLNVDQLQNLAAQSEAMAEALYVTITGISQQGALQTIYGTTDPAVIGGEGERISTDAFVIGLSTVTDPVTPIVDSLAEELNAIAQRDLGDIPLELERLSQEAQRLILGGAAESEIAQIDEIRNELLRRGRERLAEIAGPIRSVPEFDFSALPRDQTEFLFYKPVMDIVAGAGAGFEDYYRGTVRVAVSTQLILDDIDATTRDLIITTIMIAAAAVLAGVIGAYILATIVVRPINRLVTLVEKIGATENKLELKGEGLHLNSKDELNVLADSINDMVAGLIKAAEADKDLKFGKETQKAFIPLQPITDDTKRSFGELSEPDVYFFGYYEGAKGVSGDYFTYQKLSDRYYAMIKCDVAGKGIPAALIMVQVATVFQDYFTGWTPKSPGLDVSSLVLRINDIVAERQFKGRFAALTVGILDAQKGAFYLSNAGDNQLHVYRAEARTVEQLTIPGGPAAGTFSSHDLPISFPQEMQAVARGDMLLLFTDGLEEAKRLLRNRSWETFTVTQEMLDSGEADPSLSPDEDGEEFSIGRIHEIIAAVESRGTYHLQRLMEPDETAEHVFDYKTCEDDARDAVLAIVAAERIFRLVPDPSAGEDSRIQVDRIIVDYLRKHYVPFDRYFSHPVVPFSEDDGSSQYVAFTHLREDEQFDDITMLVVHRK